MVLSEVECLMMMFVIGRLNVSNEMQMNCCQPFDRGRRNHRPGGDITSSALIAARELVWDGVG